MTTQILIENQTTVKPKQEIVHSLDYKRSVMGDYNKLYLSIPSTNVEHIRDRIIYLGNLEKNLKTSENKTSEVTGSFNPELEIEFYCRDNPKFISPIFFSEDMATKKMKKRILF